MRQWVLIAGTVLLAVACRKPGAVQSTPEPVPQLQLQPERLELGRGTQDEAIEGSAAIRNTGTAPLIVDTIDASRFCTGRVDNTVVAPGQATKLLVTCRSDLYGPLREGIDVHSNDPRLPKATLQIVGDVTPLCAFDVPNVNLTMPFGEERTQEVHLVGTRAAEAHVHLTSSPAPDTEILPVHGQATTFLLRCLGRKVGANSGNIVVATGLDKPREVAIPYVCNVTGTLTVTPTNPYFNLKISGYKAVRITVKSSQPGFEVRDVRITDGPFAARFAHAEDDNTYSIDVTVLQDRIPDESRTAVGTLWIVSNDRTEPHKEVPLFGSGRINKVTSPAP